MNDYICHVNTSDAKRDLGFANFFTGIGDGLIIPFIVGMLVFSLTSRSSMAELALFVAMVIGALAFALARYFGEVAEITHNHPTLSASESEKEQLMMEYIGIDSGLRMEMNGEIAQEKDFWLKEIRENQLGWETINKRRALKGAWQTGISFFCGGLLSFLLFLGVSRIYPTFSLRFFLSTAIPVLLLVTISGGWKARFTGRSFLKGALFSLIYCLFSLSMPALIAWLLISHS